MTGVILAAVFLFFGVFFEPALAQEVAEQTSPLNVGVKVVEQPLGLPATDIRLIIARIIRIGLGLLGIILVAIVIYGGFLWMTAGGNEEQIAQAKKVLTNAIIGLVIILSAYAIVSFVIRALGVEAGPEGAPGVGAPGVQQNFQGSGALGGIIKDHYPTRGQIDVPRNTKIVITFRRPVLASSFAQNTNNSKDNQGNPVFGDCVNIGVNMNWKTDCDGLIMDDTHVSVARADNGEKISGASVLANYEQGKVYTIVIRPYDYLGSNTDKIGYKVHLGKDILVDDPANGNPSAFQVKILGNDYYEWSFTCSTALDTDPPQVSSTFPANSTTEARNTVIQIDFTESMDPTGIQGQFNIDEKNYYLDGKNVFLKNEHSTVPLGSFRLTNGYRTLEFTSTKECGQNACGGKIYCLPVCDKEGADCKVDSNEMLLKAAQTFSTSSFESVPFSGLMDLAGNAMDGNQNGKVDVAAPSAAVFPDQEKPDNYFWKFNLTSALDITAPYLKQVIPGLDAENIRAKDAWKMIFTKRMRVDPMYDIAISEQPPQQVPLCHEPRLIFNLDGTTETRMDHCPFLDAARVYYYPSLTSALEDVHFNCFYPGKGPGGASEASKHLPQSSQCGEDGTNCCQVLTTPESKAFCCNGAVLDKQSTTKDCLDYLKSTSP